MPKTVRCLLDSDVLITAKNLHYNPKFCGMFWSWIAQAHSAGNIFSIDKVREELLVGDEEDALHSWAKDPALNKFFLSSRQCATHWSKLANWANLPEKSFKEVAKAKFLDVDSADAWLIAYAAEHEDCVIVTNEVSSPFSKVSIKLPDAASIWVLRRLLYSICWNVTRLITLPFRYRNRWRMTSAVRKTLWLCSRECPQRIRLLAQSIPNSTGGHQYPRSPGHT